ncbi:putative protein [Arabidopsis thaliana]|uniref:Uncharacterized protein At3g43530 n=1 Tax=Arabidopsis thaliana TaxID=3702 RepID=Y3353_ARATH|nr:RecName: Full=Uncharacterized protein At3g43530 [Arabidopsis thaliana]CAB81793.1 putative protein [Arabidopsis thaliana]
MARTKNAGVPLAAEVVSQTINDEVVVASAAEVDSEATNLISNDDRADSDEETEALQPLKMYFGPSDYTKPFKITAKCYLHKAVGLLESHLEESELKWFLEHPQFKHFFHMHKDPNHKVMGMWLLFIRTTCLDKKGSMVYCQWRTDPMFGPGATIQYPDVEKKLLSMKKPSEARLRVVVLYFLCNRWKGVVADLELCKTFPWGKNAFEENYLAFEAIPVLRKNFCEDIESADPQCPRMCKMKFKSSTMKGFPMSDVYDKLGTTKSILAPTPDENLLLKRIMDKECGVNDVDDLIADGWKKRLVDEERTICFEPLFNEDVAHQSFVANNAPSTVVQAPRKAAVEKKGKGKTAAALTSPSDEGLTEVVNEMKNLMENGFKSMNKRMTNFSKKYEEQDKRLKLMETAIKSIQSSTGTDDAYGSKEIDDRENELEEGSDANGGDNEREVREKETEIDKEVAQGDNEREVGEKETEIDKEVGQGDSDIFDGNKDMELNKEVAESTIGVAESEKDKEVTESEKDKEVAESEIGVPESEKDIEVADSEKDKEVPQDDEMDGGKVTEPSKKRGKSHDDGDDPSEGCVKKPKVVKKVAKSRTDAKPVYRSPIQTRYARKKTKKNV